MQTLQRTIKYLGDVAASPVDKVTVIFTCPVFGYNRVDSNRTQVDRSVISSDKHSMVNSLSDVEYRVVLPVSNLSGKEKETITNFLLYTLSAFNREDFRLDDLSFGIEVSYLMDSSMPIGADQFRALYFIKDVQQLLNAVSTGVVRVSNFNSSAPDLLAYLEKNIFLLNKDVYHKIVEEFKAITHLNSPYRLFEFIMKLVEALDLDPTKPFDLTEEMLDKVVEVIRAENIENPEEVIRFIKKYFNRLFDFPLGVPAIEPLKVAGRFHVKTGDGSTLDKKDLVFYDLSLEYTTQSQNTVSTVHIFHYDWSKNTNDIGNNGIVFSFEKQTAIILNSISSEVTVKVKGFDGSVLWTQDYNAHDAVLADLFIEVALLRPNTLARTEQGVDGKKKIRGQVVELSKKCSLKDAIVLIQAKKEGSEVWQVVGAASTDSSGNFTMAYPYGNYEEAQALVSLTPNSPVDITINRDGEENERISDAFLYLLITSPECEEVKKDDDDDCDCHSPKKAPRLPDQSALINSDEYTQDIGGSCINLTTPNRTLREYSYQGIVRTSDPDVANYTLKRGVDGRFELAGVNYDLVGFQLVGENKKIKRAPVDLDNPIRWQDAPEAHANLSIYQAVTIATGHILHYKSEFRADGYSLGDLLYSLALAPGQKKQIVVFDSSHSLQGAESQTISQGERLAAGLVDEREITDQLAGSINESMQGQSSASTGGISAGLGAAGSIGVVSASLGVAGGYSNSNSSASQNSGRNTSQFFGEKLRQAIVQNADSYRQLNASVVTSVQEGQHYNATTEVVANHNHCHALTMMYFEVLRHYAIFQELVQVEECVFVPLLMTNFTSENIYKWADVLARHLLPISSNTYLQPYSFLMMRRPHPLLRAFDANERIKTKYQNVDFPTGAYSDEPITSMTGYLTIKANIPRPKTKYDRILSFPVIKREVVTNSNGGGIFGAIADVVVGEQNVSKEWLERKKFVDEYITIYDNFQEAKPADVIEVIKFDNFFNSGTKDEILWTVIATLCGYSSVSDFLANYFAHKTISQWDITYNDEIAPKVFDALVRNTISIAPFSGIDFTSTGKYHGGERLMRLTLRANTSLARKDIPSIKVNYAKPTLVSDFWSFAVPLQIENLNINYTTRHYQGYIINKYLGDDLEDGTLDIPTPMNSDEQRNPRKEDIYLVNKLIEHLNSNLEHYNKMLWYNLDVDRRYMLLDGFNIQIYNDFGIPTVFRSLASVVKNQLITIAGNSLVFPVAAGYRVSQSYITEENREGQQVEVSLFDHYKPLTPIPPYRISVPSRGVFLEAVQGACDACEKIKENSAQDWERFKADEPTPIGTVTPPVPTITDWKAVFKDFAPPMINIQNAPSLPEPGAGLSGLTELLGKSGIFKDITGLDANQQNVIRTYLSNQENARAFAEMAKGMAMQGHNTQNSDRIMDTLKTAKDNGAINQEEYSKLTKQHIQKQIDGGEGAAKESEAQNKSHETSPIKSAVELAKTGNKDVSASESDGQGNTKTLEVKSKEATIGTGTPPDNQSRVRAFIPDRENTLVVDGQEMQEVANLTNWKGLYKDASGAFSDTKFKADRNFDDPVNPGHKKYCAGAYRSPASLNKIVLHETAGFGNYTSVSQFNVAKFKKADGTEVSYKAMPHFCINQDGSIIQFLDVTENAEHGEDISSSSIGIEFVNHPWGQDGMSQDGSMKGGITPLVIPAISGYPSLNNKHVKTCLYIPSAVQLESLVRLVEALFSATSLTSLRKNWLNVININPAKFATEKLDDLKAYFILTKAKTYLTNTKYAAINENVTSEGWSLNAPGVYNHSLYGSHLDGMIQSFYTWLRLGQNKNAADAMETFKNIMKDESLRVSGGSGVALVDVGKVVYVTT